MDELIKKVQERTGISEDKARQAVQVVVEQLKSRLPASVSGELDRFVSGQSGGIGSELGGLLGKKTA